jgi:hypothetical protein
MACQCKQTCKDPTCDICAAAGAKITLVTIGTSGKVQFASARYNGKELAVGAPVSKITFEVIAGKKHLTAAYVFSLGEEGAGELHEDCGGSTQVLINDLTGTNEVRRHRICGE